MNSALFVGHVRHRRFGPVKHSFSYPMFMPFIDLDELDLLQASVRGFGVKLLNFARFRQTDYLRESMRQRDARCHEEGGCQQDGGRPGDKKRPQDHPHSGDVHSGSHSGVLLKQALYDKLESLTGVRMQGRVMLLCQLRYAGIYFSPLNLYYFYDEQDNWRWVLAEVSNTPWNERYYYALPATTDWTGDTWQEQKGFHVSPFNPMSQYYCWRLKEPGKQLLVHLDIHSVGSDQKVLDATLMMKRQPFTTKELWQLIAQTPIQTVKIVTGIYWQALKLWLKGSPFYGHMPSRPPSLKHLPSKQKTDS